MYIHIEYIFSYRTKYFVVERNQGMFVKHYAPGGNKVQKAIFSFKVKVKVTRSLTLVSFERASLLEYAKYEVSISYGSKVTAKVKVGVDMVKN